MALLSAGDVKIEMCVFNIFILTLCSNDPTLKVRGNIVMGILLQLSDRERKFVQKSLKLQVSCWLSDGLIALKLHFQPKSGLW